MDSPLPNSDSKIEEPRAILVRGVNWLGDAVMTTPALRRLRERFPNAHLALATPEKLAPLWQGWKTVDEIIPIAADARPWGVANRIKAANQPHKATPSSAPPFDLALVLPNSPRSAFEVWLADIPRRVGYARPWRNWLLTQKVPSRPDHRRMVKLSTTQVRQLVRQQSARTHPMGPINDRSHHVHEYLHLAAAVGANPTPVAPQLAVDPNEIDAASKRLVNLAGVSSPASLWLGLNPSAAYGPAKCWPADRFAATAQKVMQQLPGAIWVILGGDTERSIGAQIARETGGQIIDLTGQTSLRQLMATLKLCRVLLTNDSGPMHVAAALGTPVIAFFGSTSPALTRPGLPGDPQHRLLQTAVPCSPCFLRECPIDLQCLTGISVESAVSAVVDAVHARG